MSIPNNFDFHHGLLCVRRTPPSPSRPYLRQKEPRGCRRRLTLPVIRNVLLAVRTLLKSPVVTSVALVSLALRVGANAAIFSLFNQLLLRPLPVTEPERLVNLGAPGPKPGRDTCNRAGRCDAVFSYPMFRDLRRDQTAFTDIAGHRTFGLNITFGGQTVSGEGVQISGSYFPTLGLVPELGRLFGPEVDVPIGGHPQAVLSHDFWQTRLDSDPTAIGTAIVVNGQPMTIVGVAPAGFRGTTLGVRPMIFVPMTMRGRLVADTDEFDNRRSYWVYLFARLAPDVSRAQASAQLEPLYRSILTEVEAPLQINMSDQTMSQFLAKPILLEDGRRGQSGMDEEASAPLILLFVVTGIVVLIACANIANLLLARAAARTSEMAVRLSLGASRRQLLTQLLTESCLLSLMGGIAGILVAGWTLRLVGTLLPPNDATTLQLTLDPAGVGFTLAISALTGLLFGIFPALHSTRSDLITVLKDQAGQPAGARTAARFRTGLVVAQVALSMTLLGAAGLPRRELAQCQSRRPRPAA